MIKKYLVALMLILSLIVAGCGSSNEKDSTKTNSGKINVEKEIKDINGQDLEKKVASFLANSDVDNAIAVGIAAAKKEPNNVGVLFNLSNAYFFKKDLNNMIEIARKMEKVAPNNPLVLNQLAWALIDSGKNPEEGLDKVSKAINIIQKNRQAVDVIYFDTRALGLYKTGKKDQAAFIYKSMLSRVEDGEVYLHYAKALLDLGNKSEAKEIIKQGNKFLNLQLKDANYSDLEHKHLEDVKKEFDKLSKQVK